MSEKAIPAPGYCILERVKRNDSTIIIAGDKPDSPAHRLRVVACSDAYPTGAGTIVPFDLRVGDYVLPAPDMAAIKLDQEGYAGHIVMKMAYIMMMWRDEKDLH